MIWLLEILKTFKLEQLNIAQDAKYDGYQTGLSSIVCKFFGKKSAPLADISTAGSGLKNEIKNELKQNKQ